MSSFHKCIVKIQTVLFAVVTLIIPLCSHCRQAGTEIENIEGLRQFGSLITT